MIPAQSAARQRYFLLMSFILLFGISLVLILFEPERRQEFSDVPVAQAQIAAVAGEQIDRTALLAAYREQAKAVMAIINTQARDIDLLTKTHSQMIGQIVPGPYQKLHLKLVSLLSSLLQENAPADYIIAQEKFILDEFPWLYPPL